MANVRTDSKTKGDSKLEFIGADEFDDVLEDPEFSREFEPVFWMLSEVHDIKMDPTLSAEKQRESANIGLLSHEWGNWRVSLNWSTHWNEDIPPHHYRVEWASKFSKTAKEPVAVLSPYFLYRTCPFCRAGDPRAGGNFDIRRLRMATWIPRHPLTGGPTPPDLPACAPAHACRGPFYDGKLLGTCRQFDWFGEGIFLGSAAIGPREVFQRECSEELERLTNETGISGKFQTPDDHAAAAAASDIGSSSIIV